MYKKIKKISPVTSVVEISATEEKKSGQLQKYLLCNKKLMAGILAVVATIVVVVMAVTLIFGGDWVENALNPWMVVIAISIIGIALVNLVQSKTSIEGVKKTASFFLVVAIIAFVGKKSWPAIGPAVSGMFSKTPSFQEIGIGEYEMSLKNGEESEWITFKPNLKVRYAISTNGCGSDSLIVAYSDGEEITMWGDDPLLPIGRNSGREARIKLLAKADLVKIKLTVK